MARKPTVVNRIGSVATHGDQRPHTIVLHSTEGGGTGENVAAFWHRQGDGLGAHFHVGRNGRIVQFASSDKVCWAVYGHNTGYIDIEIEGYAAWSRARWLAGPRQYLALARLIAFLTARWGIRLAFDKAHGVCRHLDFRDVPASMYHHDPGPGFPTMALIQAAKTQRRLGW